MSKKCILDIGCGTGSRAEMCWLTPKEGVLPGVRRLFKQDFLDIVGLDFFEPADPPRFTFDNGNFRGVGCAEDLPDGADAILWRYPTPSSIFDFRHPLTECQNSFLTFLTNLIRTKLCFGGHFLFETDLPIEYAHFVHTRLRIHGLESCGEFQTNEFMCGALPHVFGQVYRKSPA